MSNVQASGQAIKEALGVCNSTINMLRTAQRGMNCKYVDVGADWNDSKYQELGAVVNECNASINKALRELQTCLMPLKGTENSILEYESVNIISNASILSSGDSSSYQNEGSSLFDDDYHVHHVVKNKEAGLRREHFVGLELLDLFPEQEGYEITREAHFRDSSGERVHDPDTGTGRRIDFVVVDRNGVIIELIEVTSKNSDKTSQLAKEERIRSTGGNYIRCYDGRLMKIPDGVRTKIRRWEELRIKMKIIDKATWHIDGGIPVSHVVRRFKNVFYWLHSKGYVVGRG